MAGWIFQSAYQEGQAVRITLVLDDPARLSAEVEKVNYAKYPQETNNDFINRVRTEIRSRLDGLNRRYANEIDRTSVFMPPQQGGG